MGNPLAAGSSLTIVSAMITPAILILAAGSLVNTTLVRLGRAVDRPAGSSNAATSIMPRATGTRCVSPKNGSNAS